MNTFLSRANNVFAFTLTVLALLTFGCFVSTFFKDYNLPVDLKAVKHVVKHVKDFSVGRELNDLGIVNVDISADLTGLFDWNTKMLFVYLTAEYSTEKNKLNQVVLWDKIIERGENAILNYKNMNSEYYYFDDGSGLKGNPNITLYLSWNVIPNAGLLPRIFADQKTETFAFPNEYTYVRV
ncbi:signal peptidase complex subunit 3-like [Xenia sp. Carnegie-2017]|uniref:signal peptidase complex subunit 3-like n=1 Tax=Xenia sp. Carnegie-2017 TaxID=2897299 RepID=UPI001F036646|nr:signal peptidase complex subunit 3-like [Xenia sp. Carnegie-2017]